MQLQTGDDSSLRQEGRKLSKAVQMQAGGRIHSDGHGGEMLVLDKMSKIYHSEHARAADHLQH